jgi:hypothetical protein
VIFPIPHGNKIKLKLAIFVVEYLCEYESIFEAALDRESVAPGVLFHEKPETVPLRTTEKFTAIISQTFSWQCLLMSKLINGMEPFS